MQALLLTALFALTALPAGAGQFDGVYKPAGLSWSCQARDLGMDGGAVGVFGDQFLGVENTCTLTNPTPIPGLGAVAYTAECNGEGMTYTYPLMLMTQDNGIYVITEGYVADWTRCP